MQPRLQMEKNDVKDERVNEFHLSQLASVGQIAAGIAHEVRNPLTAVKGFLQLLKEKNDEKYIEIAQSELDNALVTLENLLQVSKPDLADEPCDAVTLSVELESLLNLFQDQKYHVQVITDLQNTDKCIYGKKGQLKRALFNLLKNAFEAIPEQGFIKIEHFATNEYIVVTIQDSGVGIPQEQIKMLGTPFFSTKQEGTGMGLTQAFSVIYQHGGHIEIKSKANEGTKFTLFFPLESQQKIRRVVNLDLVYTPGQNLRDFFLQNQEFFQERLLHEAVNVRDQIDKIHAIGNINLLNNAQRLVLYIVEGREHEMISFAKEEGIAWARFSLTLAFKLEWIQTVRRVLWDLLYNYDRLKNDPASREEFFSLEKQINELVDQFINYFFISYSQYKDELLVAQREMVEHLAVPIIPLTTSICILPLIGSIDLNRAYTIEDKVLKQISISRIETLIMDLSGVVEMDTAVIEHLIKVLDGVAMMGCKTVITGLGSEIVKRMIALHISFDSKAETKGTLQQALVSLLVTNQSN